MDFLGALAVAHVVTDAAKVYRFHHEETGKTFLIIYLTTRLF